MIIRTEKKLRTEYEGKSNEEFDENSYCFYPS
jgi:hypothetical protein